jgi:hypothetical protein
LAAQCLKKYFIDGSKGAVIDSAEDLEQMKQSVMRSLDFKQPMSLLQRKGDIISTIYSKQQKNEDLLKLLIEWAGGDNSSGREFSMYLFQEIADYHMTDDQIKAYKDDLMKIFMNALEDREMGVKVAALKAISAFLTSISETDLVL